MVALHPDAVGLAASAPRAKMTATLLLPLCTDQDNVLHCWGAEVCTDGSGTLPLCLMSKPVPRCVQTTTTGAAPS